MSSNLRLGSAKQKVCLLTIGAAVAVGTGYKMKFFKRFLGKGEEVVPATKPKCNLAFVLLTEPQLPSQVAVVEAFAAFEPSLLMRAKPSEARSEGGKEMLSLELAGGETCFVALMPAAVPKGEADDGVKFSLSSFRDGWKLPQHHAHLIVIFRPVPGAKAVEDLSRFTSIVAAIVKASGAVGVYWGDSGATHDAEFFTSVAADQGVSPRILLWSGMSSAREPDGRLGLLSLGMRQLGLHDLLLVAGKSSEGSAIETFYDFLTYVAERGEPLSDGDTVGRSADEKLPVRYVPSPLDPTRKVWRVEMP